MAKPKNIDEYISETEGTFAYPILTRIREIIHETTPDIEETIKWGAPSFEYKGLMMSMVTFKKFAAVWFHKGALFNDPDNLLKASSEETKSMRKYIIPAIDDLDEEGLRGLILEAIKKQESGEQVKGYNTNEKWKHSDLLFEALEKDPAARERFEEFAPYKQKEFIEHIESAKQDATKQRRLEKDLELIRKELGYMISIVNTSNFSECDSFPVPKGSILSGKESHSGVSAAVNGYQLFVYLYRKLRTFRRPQDLSQRDHLVRSVRFPAP